MSEGAEIVVDVRDLEAPEPLRKLLPVIESLGDGQFVRVIHRRDGHCLCALVADLGFESRVRETKGQFEIWIWRSSDRVAALGVQESAGP